MYSLVSIKAEHISVHNVWFAEGKALSQMVIFRCGLAALQSVLIDNQIRSYEPTCAEGIQIPKYPLYGPCIRLNQQVLEKSQQQLLKKSQQQVNKQDNHTHESQPST